MLKNKKHREKYELSSNTIATISSIVIILGLFIFFYNYINAKKEIAYLHINNVLSKEIVKKTSVEETTEQPTEEINNEESQTQPNAIYNYIGYLEIPKINIKKGFVKKENKANDVERNIFIVDASDYPNKDKGNFIIAAHSGTGWKAFFNDLYKLEKGDIAYVEYQNKKYTYKIEKIYKQNKTGTIAIYRDYDRTTLTLVTCTNNDSTTQTVYIAYLENIE